MTTQADWQQTLASCIKDPVELLKHLDLTHLISEVSQHPDFTCRVPLPFFDRIQKGDINDPLLRQVLPLNEEHQLTPGYSTDPLKELQATPKEGLLHKYHGRILLTLTGACAVHCRYCFRRHFPYSQNSFSSSRWQEQLQYLETHSDIHEVILSGGDPLTLKDSMIERIVRDIEKINHIQTLRIHTRLPIVIPSRVTEKFCQTLQNTPLRTVMVIHCNHANEIDSAVASSTRQLQQAGVTLLNQSVMLKHVNDNATSLIDLSFALHRIGVLPYYLHLPDKTQGTAHFDVSQVDAQQYIAVMRTQLPGYLVPRLAVEIPGQPSKTVID